MHLELPALVNFQYTHAAVTVVLKPDSKTGHVVDELIVQCPYRSRDQVT